MDWFPKLNALIQEKGNISVHLKDSVGIYFISKSIEYFQIYIIITEHEYYYINVEQTGNIKLYDYDDTLIKQFMSTQQASHIDSYSAESVDYHERLTDNTKAFSIYPTLDCTHAINIDFSDYVNIAIRYRNEIIICLNSTTEYEKGIRTTEHPPGRWAFLLV